MAEDAPGDTAPQDTETTPPPVTREPATRQPRSRESWEPQQREVRRPDFVSRLAKTSDLPTEIGKEREKSKLGEHRLAAIQWEDDPDEAGEEDDAPDEGKGEAGLTRGQIATLAALGVVVAVLGVTWFAKSLLIGGGAAPVPPALPPAGGSSTREVRPTLSDAEYAEATAVMRTFLEALTPDDLRAVLRDPERVWPMVEAHHRRTPWKPFLVRRLPAKHEIQMNRGLLAGSVEVDDYQRFVVAMENTPSGIKVDWETFTGQGEMSWDDFVSKRSGSPVLMRVALRADDYFNRDFPDASTHACYRLTSHNDTHRMYGYVERGSPVHALLAARTRTNPRIMPTLRLRYPENSTANDQVEITEMVADGWLVTENTRIKDEPPEASTPDEASPEKPAEQPE